MQITKPFRLIIILSLLLNSLTCFAFDSKVDTKNDEAIAKNFLETTRWAEDNCINKKTNEIYSELKYSDGKTIHTVKCEEVLKSQISIDEENNITAAEDEIIVANDHGLQCDPLQADSLNPIKELSNSGTDIAEILTCKTTDIEANEKSCSNDVTCNVIRSVMPLLGIALAGIKHFQKIDAKPNSCLSINKSSCLTDALAIINNIVGNAKMVGELLVTGAKWAGGKIIDSWNYFSKADTASSAPAMAASLMNEETINEVNKNPESAISKMGKELYRIMADAIKQDYMCDEWAGAPHLSKCNKEFKKPWECASCDQKMNAMCGIAGFAVGEIVTAYLTGGSIQIAGAAVRTTALGAKVVSIANKGASAISRGTTKIAKFLTRKKRAEARLRILGMRKALSSASKGTNAGVKLSIKPLTEYTKLTDEAMRLGLKHSDAVPIKISDEVLKERTRDKLMINLINNEGKTAEQAKRIVARTEAITGQEIGASKALNNVTEFRKDTLSDQQQRVIDKLLGKNADKYTLEASQKKSTSLGRLNKEEVDYSLQKMKEADKLIELEKKRLGKKLSEEEINKYYDDAEKLAREHILKLREAAKK